jgi:hypothetical protein
METTCSLPCLQGPVTESQPEPYETSAHHTSFMTLLICPNYGHGLQSELFHLGHVYTAYYEFRIPYFFFVKGMQILGGQW